LIADADSVGKHLIGLTASRSALTVHVDCTTGADYAKIADIDESRPADATAVGAVHHLVYSCASTGQQIAII